MGRKKNINQDLWAITSPVKLYMIIAVFLSMLSGVMMIAGNVLLVKVMTQITGGHLTIFNLSLDFKNSFILLTVIVMFSFVIKYYSFIVSHMGAFRLEEMLRTELTDHLGKVPLGYVISTGTGALKKVLLDDVRNLHAFVADTTPMIGKSIATPLASLVVMLIFDVRLALIAVGVLLLGMIIMRGAMKDDVIHRKKYEQSQSDINKAVIEFVQAMPVVRTFDDGRSSFKRYSDALERYKYHTKKWIELTSMSGKIAMIILSPLPTLIAVTFAGIVFIKGGSLSFINFTICLVVSTGMADALLPVMWMNQALKKSHASAARIDEIRELPVLKQTVACKVPETYELAFHEVSFSYDNDDHYALSHVSFQVPEKTTTALVGASGAGKSTVARLIPRFWDVTKGHISIGGIDIRHIEIESLMNIVSFVFQETFLFNMTIEENIRMANEHGNFEDIVKAAKSAQIHDFIMSLPKGYQSTVGDRGTQLSGGQKQRITIARAILRDTPIVVLDEATAYADPENEEAIVNALSNLMKNKTVIVIAHRLSTIKDVDQIVVFDQGRIVEKGQHDHLMKEQGLYADFWRNYRLAQQWDMHHHGGVQ